MAPSDINDRARLIRFVMMDVDGVLTDGRIVYGDHGDEIKSFDVQDGLGLSLLHQAGIKTAMVTSRRSRINARRAKEVGVKILCQNAKDKAGVFEKFLKKYRLTAAEVCVIGDDWVDAAAMKRAGLAVAVANAAPELRTIAHAVTSKNGGRGAVREVAEWILKSQNKWAELFEKYFSQ